MAKDTSIESLFKEHSFEEIEGVRDNLAQEIDKRTELLKSIVKEKYKDVVETSDAIHTMKTKLEHAERSVSRLDQSISEFYISLREPIVHISSQEKIYADKSDKESVAEVRTEVSQRVLKSVSEIWNYYDSGDLKTCVKCLNEALNDIEAFPDKVNESLLITVRRAKEIIQNSIWCRIKSAKPDQIGIIAGSEQEELYRLSLGYSIDLLLKQFLSDISETSYHSIIRRHHPVTLVGEANNQAQVPSAISPELSVYLFNVCQTINTIAGFDLSRALVVESLKLTLTKAIQVYDSVLVSIETLSGQTRRRRASQLYFDLIYLRILLNTSKNIDLIEELDPAITQLSAKYEVMLDTIELYMISEALHSNAVQLSRSTFRLYGLLIPHLQ